MASFLWSLIICFALYAFGSCSSTSEANNTSPWDLVDGWAPESNGNRGTMDIIWTCLVTIFACSWTATHPEFPHKGLWGSKIRMSAIAVVAPELMAYKAVDEYFILRRLTNTITKQDNVQWSMAQSFFVHMGGVKLEFKNGSHILGHSHNKLFDDPFRAIRCAIRLDLLAIKSVSVESIKSRAKTNPPVKAVVCLQASWLVAQAIGRVIAHLPITSLEIVTVGYVICALITYASCWHKPQDAEVMIEVDCFNTLKEEYLAGIPSNILICGIDSWWEACLKCSVAGLFGAIHCLAWNFSFATSAETLLWWIASVSTMALPMFTGFQFLDRDIPSFSSSLRIPYKSNPPPTWFLTNKWLILLLVIYLPFRLYLMVEPFVAFRSIPVGVFYTVNWARWIPHV